MPTIRADAKHRTSAVPTLNEIARLVGGEDAAVHTAILATGATFVEIEQALLAAGGVDEPLGQAAYPLEGCAAAVYEILTAESVEAS
jgi:hypothetical protein